jgi:hypothetical protein
MAAFIGRPRRSTLTKAIVVITVLCFLAQWWSVYSTDAGARFAARCVNLGMQESFRGTRR